MQALAVAMPSVTRRAEKAIGSSRLPSPLLPSDSKISDTLPAIHVLPVEILAHIFSLLQMNADAWPFVSSRRCREWIFVTHVCQRWRNAAFAFSNLWGNIDFDNRSHPDVIHSFFQRAAQSCTRVSFSQLDIEDGKVHQYVIENPDIHTKSLRALHLSSPLPFSDAFWNAFGSCAPELESLTIRICSDDRQCSTMLPQLFDNHTPRLKKLSLSRISAWPRNDFCGLTHLGLYDQPRRVRPTLHQFLEILEASPALEVLILKHAGPNLHNLPCLAKLVRTPVSLLSLRRMEIAGWGHRSNVAFFLSHLIISPQANRLVWGKAYLGDIASLLAHHSTDIKALKALRRVVVTHLSSSRTQLVAIRGSTLYIHGPVDFSQYEFLLRRGLLPGTEELVFWPSSVPTISQFTTLLSGLPALRSIIVTGSVHAKVYRLLSVLGLFNDEDKTIDNKSVLCPNLDSLGIYRYKEQGDEDASQSVAILAEKRAQSGNAIRRVRIESYPGDSAVRLRACVPDVELVNRTEGCEEGYFEDALLKEVWIED